MTASNRPLPRIPVILAVVVAIVLLCAGFVVLSRAGIQPR